MQGLDIEAYRKKIQKRLYAALIYIGIVALFLILSRLHPFPDSHSWLDFLQGGLLAFELIMLFRVCQWRGMLKDPFWLEDACRAESDEREQFLWQQASRMAVQISFYGLVLLGMGAVYWSPTVGLVMIGCGCFTAGICKLLKRLYGKRC